jgi:NAD-dependent dihydropyrimidine dehydrogenase PreA subunit
MVQIDRERCTGCGACMEACPTEAITIQDGFAQVGAERCTGCGACVEVCPQGAVLLLPEPAPAAGSQRTGIMEPVAPPADRSGEIITVRVPPPTLVPARPSPARQLGLALGAALSYLGREVAPRLLRLAADWVQEQMLAPQEPSSRGTPRQGGSGGSRHRRRQRQRGRQ